MLRLYVLGAGTPTPTKERFGTSCVLQTGDRYVMFDCGPATTYRMVRAGLFPTQIDCLFFTHHHSDHNSGYPAFFLSRFDQCRGKEELLRIFGPSPTAEMTEKLFGQEGAYVHDIRARCEAPVSQAVHANRGGTLPRQGPRYEARDLADGDVVTGPGWEVKARSTHHVQPWLESLAYRVESEDGAIVFAGDTGPSESVIELAKGADVLVANCWDHQDTMAENKEAPGQTGTRDAGRFAAEAGVKKLVCMHIGAALAAPGSRERGIAEIASLFDGEIVFAEELMVLDL